MNKGVYEKIEVTTIITTMNLQLSKQPCVGGRYTQRF